MPITSRTFLTRSALALAGVFACSTAMAMPFCGNKGGYKNAYRYAPVYAYPAVMPAYTPAPRQHVHSWDRINVQAPTAAPTGPQAATVATKAVEAR